MNYIAKCLEKFRQLPESTKNILGSLEVLTIIKKLEEKYDIKLSFLIVLVAIGEVSLSGISEYLEKKYNFREEDAFELRSELVREVFSLLLINNSEIEISEATVKDIFATKIVEFMNDASKASELNHGIFTLFSQNGALQEELNKIFLNNQEKVATSRITLEGREVSPTITNWLKDFIKFNGSDIFDDLALAQYLSASANAKNLPSDEKELVRKLLKLYRNLAFFPESLENYSIKDWQIIPIDINAVNVFSDVLDDGELAEKIEPVIAKPVRIEETSKVKITENKKEITPFDELKQTLTQYASDSLEYKAVLQEIGRLKKKKK